MEFLAGLLPGLLLGVAIGLMGTAIARHVRPLAKAMVKGGLLAAGALGRVGGRLRAQLDALVVEARADMARQGAADEQEPPPPPRRIEGPFI